jgi:hypothetical protein
MKQFLAFFGLNYYPNGGINDFSGDFDTLEEAIDHLEKEARHDEAYDGWSYQWGHIYDTEKRMIIWESP